MTNENENEKDDVPVRLGGLTRSYSYERPASPYRWQVAGRTIARATCAFPPHKRASGQSASLRLFLRLPLRLRLRSRVPCLHLCKYALPASARGRAAFGPTASIAIPRGAPRRSQVCTPTAATRTLRVDEAIPE